MRGGRDRGEPRAHIPLGPCTSASARRRRTNHLARAARAAAELEQTRQARAAEADVRAAQLAAAERARAARDHTDFLRDAAAAAHLARLEARFQQGQESRLDFESAVISRRLADASARVASEGALCLDLESLAAVLQAALLASQQELAQLWALRDRSPPPPPVFATPVVGAAVSPAAGLLNPDVEGPAQRAALPPDCRDETIASLNFRVQELYGAAFQRRPAFQSLHRDRADPLARRPAQDQPPWVPDP